MNTKVAVRRVKKNMALILLFLLMAFVLVGCGTAIKEGWVIEKKFMPAHTKVMFIPVVVSNSKSFTSMLVPYFFFYPDRWSIKIKEGDKTATYWTTKEMFDVIEVGFRFEFDADRDLTEEPVEKVRKEA